MPIDPEGHKHQWAALTPGCYLIKCECGWSATTAADSPQTSIRSTYEAHLVSQEEQE